MKVLGNALVYVAIALTLGCGAQQQASHSNGHSHGAASHGHAHDDGHGHDHGHGHGWQVTAWGETFEVFAVVDPLIAAHSALAAVHVTHIATGEAINEGVVELVLMQGEEEESFLEGLPEQEGIYEIMMDDLAEGSHELWFRIETDDHFDEIRAGEIRVGNHDEAGGLVRATVASVDAIEFTKEQQWRTRLSTGTVSPGEVSRVLRGPGRVRPVAGGQVVLAASTSALVQGTPWPVVGQHVASGEDVFALTPYVAADRSLAELESADAQKRAELQVAEDRLERLESLLPVQATSVAEVERARARVVALRAQVEAASSDLHTRSAGPGRKLVEVTSPIAGKVAAIEVQPGQRVSSGEILGRIVRTEPFWVEVHLRPESVTAGVGSRLSLRGPGQNGATSIPAERVRLVSQSPEVDARTGTVTWTFEVSGAAPVLLGSVVEAEVTLVDNTVSGIVVPVTALVDDGGATVVYVQHAGEEFVRRDVEVLAREGERVALSGLSAEDRVVTRGGDAIRRATLVASGAGHGHVH